MSDVSPAIAAAKAAFEKVQARQQQLGWSDEQLVSYASEKLTPLDPYGRLKITTVEFLSRVSPSWQDQLLQMMQKESA